MSIFQTEKVYYRLPYATRQRTQWARREPGVIAVAHSVAFPEGGGQLPDHGELRQGGQVVPFRDTQKVFGRPVFRKDFPHIQVEGEVRLHLEAPLPDDFDESQPIDVLIDVPRRAKLTRSHTAAHLVYLGLLEAVPSAKEAVRSCSIDRDGGRFDLRLGRLTTEQVEQVFQTALAWQQGDYPIVLDALPGEPECRLWLSNGATIPCGGTHLPRTGLVGGLRIQRRGKGKDLERLYYTLTDPLPEELLQMYQSDTPETPMNRNEP
jgi:alanyl-tRNA synthetase